MSHVISNAYVSGTLLTDDSFRQLLTAQAPLGFGPFQQFVPGDYEYERAVFRISMNSTSGDRGIINRLQVDVDVPDMLDRGAQIITPAMALAGPTWVQFTRPFHIPPVPVVTIMSATEDCVARVIEESVTRAGFMVQMLKTDGSGRTHGVVSWAAHSY